MIEESPDFVSVVRHVVIQRQKLLGVDDPEAVEGHVSMLVGVYMDTALSWSRKSASATTAPAMIVMFQVGLEAEAKANQDCLDRLSKKV